MKFYDRATEGTLKAWAQQSLTQAGRKFAPRDWRIREITGQWWYRVFIANPFIMIYMVWLSAGLSSQSSRASESIIVEMLAVGYAMVLRRRLEDFSFHSSTAQTLMHLPVPGEQILEWARRQVLWLVGMLILWALAGAWGLHGFRAEPALMPAILLHGLLLWWMAMATAILLMHPRTKRWRLGKIFGLAIAVWLLIAWLGEVLPAWVQQWQYISSWALPTSWVRPDRIYGIGGLMAVLLGCWGIWYWWRWPAYGGHALELPLNIGEPVPSQRSQTNKKDISVDVEEGGWCAESATLLQNAFREAAEPPSNGWVERLVWKCLAKKDRAMARAVAPQPLRWSLVLNGTAVACLLGLTLAFASHHGFFQQSWAVGAATLTMLLSCLFLATNLPISNMIPGALVMWNQGAYELPLFAGLPIGARDLLRISTRFTVVRTLLFMSLMIPMLITWEFLFTAPQHRWHAVRILLVCGAMWTVSRPAFIVYRVITMYKGRRRAIFGEACSLLAIGSAGMAWLGSGCGVLIFVSMDVYEPAVRRWLIIGAALAAHGLLARLMFEIFHWRLRTGKLDLIRLA